MAETTEEFRHALADVLAAHEQEYPSVRAAAKAMGVAKSAVYDLLNGYTRPSPKMLKAVSKVFPAEAARLYRAAGEAVPADLVPPATYCAMARSLSEQLNKPKEAVIEEALRQYAEAQGAAV